MATLTVGTGASAVIIQLSRTLEFYAVPVQSEDGVDYGMTQLDISVEGWLNRKATVVPDVSGNPPDTAGGIGGSLLNLQTTLMIPRQQITYSTAQGTVNTTALAAPVGQQGPVPNPGQTFTSDPRWGPLPLDCKVTLISGDKSALIYYKVRCWVNSYSHIVLVNRWEMSESIDDEFYTTITYRGQALFRTSLLVAGGGTIQPDQYRASLLPPVPDQFQRRAVEPVKISSDGTRMDYVVVDEQKRLLLGANSPTVRVEALITTGGQHNIKDFTELFKMTGVPAPWAPPIEWLNFSPWEGIKKITANLIPRLLANAVVRCYGRPNSDLASLTSLAIRIALDRLWPFGQGLGAPQPASRLFVVSAFLTASVEEAFVEFRMEVFGGLRMILKNFFEPLSFTSQQDLTRRQIDGSQSGFPINPPLLFNSGSAPQLPNSSGTRGDYTGNLVSQLLGIPANLPSAPGLPPSLPDLPLA